MDGYITEEIQKKLTDSRTEVADLTSRDLICPNCHFRIETIFSDIRGHIQVKCKKCKNEYIMNLAYFRSAGRRVNGIQKVYLTKIE